MSTKKGLVLLILTAAITMMTAITGFANVYPETEPNDTKETAQPIVAGTQTILEAVNGNTSNQYFIKGNLNSSNEEDWYKISLVPSKKNYLTVNRYTGPINNKTSYSFYNSEGVLLQTFDYTSNQVCVFRLETDVAQTYYMKVASSSWNGDFTYVMQMGNPEPDFKTLEYTFEPALFGQGYPQWEGTWNLEKTTGVPRNALCFSVSLWGPSTGSVVSREFKNDNRSWWSVIDLGGTDLIPIESLKAHQKWQFRLKSTNVAANKTITPNATLSFVYSKLPVEEMQY